MSDQQALSGDRVSRSRSFTRAKSKAREYADHPERLSGLVERARDKAADRQDGRLAEVWDKLMLFTRMLRAYAQRQYTEIPLKSLLLVIASVLYFVMPIDVIPDVILGFGFVDDAALLAWAIKSVATDIEAFAEWERSNGGEEASEARPDTSGE